MQDFGSGAIPNKVHVVTISSPLLSLLPTPIAQDKYANTAIIILKQFGLEDLANELLMENGIHHPKNLVSLSPKIHSQFDKFCLWFKATNMVCY